MASVPPSVAVALGPLDVFEALNAEVDIAVDRPVFETVDMNSPLDHLAGVVDPILEGEEDSATLVLVKVSLSHEF